MTGGERQLWRSTGTRGDVECVVIGGCAGVELLVRRDGTVERRERYATRADAYERARALHAEYAVPVR